MEEQLRKMLNTAIRAFTSTMEQSRRDVQMYVAERDKDLSGRIMMLEKTGSVPRHEFDQLKHLVSLHSHYLHKNTKALQELLSFFRMTTQFINEVKTEDESLRDSGTDQEQRGETI